MDTLKVTLIQSHLHWENAVANRKLFSEKIKNSSETTDLIILPEMFTTGFTMNASTLAEPDQGPSFQWMQAEAKEKNCAITGSLIVSENGNFFNRMYFVLPNGTYHQYDKKHTFTLAGEHKVFKSGAQRAIIDYKGWRICPLICYDLRFPVWARNTENYDVLIYAANWPNKRVAAWDALLQARAIENMAYCIGVNRVGLDGNGFEYSGHSSVYDVLGAHISTTQWEQEFIETIVLSKEHIAANRNHLQFLEDRDSFTLN